MTSNKNLSTILTLAGCIPFIVGIILLYASVTQISVVGSVLNALVIYSIMIGSFMAGSHWAQYMKDSGKTGINLYFSSNIMVLALWLFYLLTPSYVVLIVLIIDFALLWILDAIICKAKIITFGYLLIRAIATAIVIICLVLTFMLVYGNGVK
jgi:hypothetical protein